MIRRASFLAAISTSLCTRPVLKLDSTPKSSRSNSSFILADSLTVWVLTKDTVSACRLELNLASANSRSFALRITHHLNLSGQVWIVAPRLLGLPFLASQDATSMQRDQIVLQKVLFLKVMIKLINYNNVIKLIFYLPISYVRE